MVTFKIFPIACHLCNKVDTFLHFIFCSFSLHLPHIELQYFRWEKIRAFIRVSLTFYHECSSLYLDRIEFHLTGSTMIWCDIQKKDDWQISLPDFLLYLPYALPYHRYYLKRISSFGEIWCWKKNAYFNSYSNIVLSDPKVERHNCYQCCPYCQPF